MAEISSSPGAPEWLVEEGIGEHRAVRLADGAIIAARVEWPGALAAGLVEDAVLVARAAGSPRGTLRFANGEEALVDGLPRGASEGAPLRARVTRAAIAERGRLKRALARVTDERQRPAPTLAARLAERGARARIVPRFPERGWPECGWPECGWPECGWEDLLAEACDGTVAFAGGALTISPTPAMTLIDVDGGAPPRDLALAAVPAIAAAIARLGLAGSIGIDFPSLAARADRQAIDAALAEALADWPHESTATNGFGFVQLVARREGPSLVERIARDPTGAAARALLRRAEGVREPGALLLTASAAVLEAVRPEWRAELARRTGRDLRWHADAALAPEAGFAQAVTR